MRLKMGRRVFDTETARLVGGITNWDAVESDDHVFFDLYYIPRSKTYFLCVDGGEKTPYATEGRRGRHIVPLPDSRLAERVALCSMTYGDAARDREGEVFDECDAYCLRALGDRGEIADVDQMTIFDVIGEG